MLIGLRVEVISGWGKVVSGYGWFGSADCSGGGVISDVICLGGIGQKVEQEKCLAQYGMGRVKGRLGNLV